MKKMVPFLIVVFLVASLFGCSAGVADSDNVAMNQLEQTQEQESE